MVQVRIVLDESKILKEQRYDLNEMWSVIDNAFHKYGLAKADKGIFKDSGNEKDYARLWTVIFALSECDWFMNNVAEWYWLNTDESGFEEDLLFEMKKANATA